MPGLGATLHTASVGRAIWLDYQERPHSGNPASKTDGSGRRVNAKTRRALWVNANQITSAGQHNQPGLKSPNLRWVSSLRSPRTPRSKPYPPNHPGIVLLTSKNAAITVNLESAPAKASGRTRTRKSDCCTHSVCVSVLLSHRAALVLRKPESSLCSGRIEVHSCY